MENNILLSARALALIQQLRQRLIDPGLCSRHRRREVDFSRQCRLTFPTLMILLLQKSVKSMQAHLHEFFRQLTGLGAVETRLSVGAVTHARAKLDAGAFVELNQQVLLPLVYGAEQAALAQQWRGHRLLGVDSSVVRLPNSPAVTQRYGRMQCHYDGVAPDWYAQGRLSVVYDLLNEVALEAHLAPWKKAEGEMALAHLRWVKPQDIVITDRGYPSFLWLAAVQSVGAHFVSRCSRSSFGQVRRLFARNRAGLSVTVTVWAPKDAKAQCRERGWPTSMKMRFVTVRLSSGELEVLATSLLDQATYPTEEFERLYWCRWGHETYFRRLKGRLDLEHCSGLTVDAVEQDCAAMVLLSNIESVVVGPATAGLRARGTAGRQPLKVNRAVSCHAMKLRLIDLLASNIPAEKVLAELTTWFMDNPVSVRKRKVPRQKFSLSRSYHHQRHVRKIVF